ncbi:PACE efflux transporter [Marinobacter salinexigens]|uniref:PACE efflux transporter n=1 Tax=Marinobacter salinexigens TaxID=2919747 RepID=A0A5B0VN12_9GAMM|nr:PACE efflux transporter [Marinobacter salinexigens]KAA1176082.1 PACE efflux transporter [Marinobacter salinexigens]
MRTTADRVRQAVSFEVIGILLSTVLGTLIFHMPIETMGVLTIIGASLATVWNYVFNLLFDHALLRARGTTRKTLGLRVLHALCFEAVLMLAFLPVIAWWLGLSLLEALVMDIAFVVFYLFYAFLFTWAYDTIFPVPETIKQPLSDCA